MLRERFHQALTAALKAREVGTVSTLRMVLAALKDRDIAERSKGNADGLGDDQILMLLQGMIKQRQESIRLYQQGERGDLAEREAAEIRIIEGFLPQQMGDAEIAAMVDALVIETGAASIKDMGKVMGVLKQRFAGQIDMAKAGQLVKQKLN